MPRHRRTTKRPYRRYRKQKKLNPREKREVKALIGRRLEHKYFSYGSSTTYTNSPTIIGLSSIAQGVGDGQRIGDTIRLVRADFRWQAFCGDYYNTIRITVFRWKSNTAQDAPTVAEIYDTSASSAEYVMCPMPALERQDSFHMVYDTTFMLQQQIAWNSSGAVQSPGSTTISPTSKYAKTWKKSFYGKRLGPKTVRYNPAVQTGWGELYMAIATDSAIAPNPTVYTNMRLTYTDA